jgi:uncharacterized delta-60 repeat protein
MYYFNFRKNFNFSFLAFIILFLAVAFAAFGTINSSAETNSVLEVLAEGDLDTSFDTDGKVTTQIGSSRSEALAIAVQPDGKFVAAGYSLGNGNTDFALARYNANGSLDGTFGGTGKVTTDIDNADNISLALAIQPADNKLVAAGCSFNGTDDDFALVRYKTDGTLDDTFGTGGVVKTNFNNSTDCIDAVAVQTDGKIVAAGYYFNGSFFRFALARYNSNGALDDTFGTGGKVITDLTAFDDLARAIALQSDGKIIVAGEANADFGLARYNSNGSLDATFDGDGKVTTSINLFDSAYDVAIQSDGKIVAAGETGNGTNSDFAAVRYEANGALDTGFDGDGIAVTPIGSGDEFASSVALQSGGKIIVGGFSSNGGNDDFALVRYNSNGSLDGTFGAGGKVTTDFGASSFDYISALAIQSGRLIAVGSANSSFAAAAYTLGLPGCAYTLTPTSANVVATGGTGSFSINTGGTGCSFTAVSNDSFITITGGGSGSGSGTVSFSVALNNVSSIRTGTITAGGQTFTITQAAPKSRKRVRFI